MTIEWEQSDEDWMAQYGIDEDLAEQMAEHQERGFHALEYGPANDAVQSFLWLVEQWNRLAGPRDEHTMVQRAFLSRAFARDGQVLLAADELRRLTVDRTAVFGEDDPQTLRTRGQLGQVLARNGLVEEGIEVLEALLEDRLRLYGPDAQPTFDSMGNLAEAYLLGHRVVEGRDLYGDLYERRSRMLGVDHPDTTRTFVNWSSARARACEYATESIEIMEHAVETMEAIAGATDDSTLTARGHLADAHMWNEDPDAAAAILNPLLVDRTMLLGPEHPDTLRSVRMLAEVEAVRRKRDRGN